MTKRMNPLGNEVTQKEIEITAYNQLWTSVSGFVSSKCHCLSEVLRRVFSNCLCNSLPTFHVEKFQT